MISQRVVNISIVQPPLVLYASSGRSLKLHHNPTSVTISNPTLPRLEDNIALLMTNLEDLQAKHRKEQKELQNKITSKKKNATKKSRKGVNDECDRLERELQERQLAEITALESSGIEEDVAKLDLKSQPDLSENYDGVHGNSSVETSSPVNEVELTMQQDGEAPASSSKLKKPNRRKAQLARRVAQRNAQTEEALSEAASMPDQRQQELSGMKAEMEKRGLTETQIRPDGHCLYSAFVETTPAALLTNYRDARLAAADYMTSHGDDFAPFLEEPLDAYTRKIKETAEWGGHLELLALAKAFDVNINVLQASGHVEKIESGSKSEKEIWLAYYRHSFGLGEHYNALEKQPTG